jgi:hypothetical protein
MSPSQKAASRGPAASRGRRRSAGPSGPRRAARRAAVGAGRATAPPDCIRSRSSVPRIRTGGHRQHDVGKFSRRAPQRDTHNGQNVGTRCRPTTRFLRAAHTHAADSSTNSKTVQPCHLQTSHSLTATPVAALTTAIGRRGLRHGFQSDAVARVLPFPRVSGGAMTLATPSSGLEGWRPGTFQQAARGPGDHRRVWQ